MKKIILLIFLSPALMADEEGAYFWGSRALPGVEPVDHALYQTECGACHMAYQPGLLPALSWEQLMLNLEQHFGENAALPPEDRKQILNYLLDHAAGRVDARLSNRLIYGLKGIPKRITELPYFIHEHREIPPQWVIANPQVGSFSRCNACHLQAEKGIYDEHQVRIPGYGYFDD